VVKFCPICRRRYDDKAEICELDGMRLLRRPDEQTGRVLGGRYKLLSRIGSGGMADVFQAVDLVEGASRAIKILRADLSQDPDMQIRFQREVRAARLVEHECVVRIFDFGLCEDGKPFIVLELLDGVGLAAMIALGPISLGRILDIVAEISRALAAAHGTGVIHRDIKPENIMILGPASPGDPERVKIFDFGLVQIIGEGRLTATGQVFGTPEYISPEQATGEDASPASDQYALGVVFYEMLTGLPPFVGPPAQVLMAQFRDAPKPPSAAATARAVPSGVDPVVLTMLAKRPAERFPDMDAVHRAVVALREALRP
jgi:eukaryotic-like serine/threonine-protein kinase